ncbi:MAG TPA: prepilin-type N-terminal cleavage/methylation domain-containing protein [Chthoniobacteraceae bacterium]|nr:prepilin-type N-terminal cleavage/methylation domain-containing protein [Chthoniobacteraceae bacterium]
MKTRAFSLIEFLVAVALISLIAVFLAGAMARVQRRAQDVECISRLRQLGAAMSLFANDHRQQIPGRLYEAEWQSGGEPLYPQWYRRLGRGGYLATVTKYGDSLACYCPAFPPASPTDSRVEQPLKVETRFGMRNWVPPGDGWTLNDPTRLLPLSAIAERGDFFLIADSYFTDRASQGYQIVPGAPKWRIHFRHGGKAHALFADWHVEAKDRAYFAAVPARQLYSGPYDGRPFYFWPEN